MDRIKAIEVFVAVVDNGSLTRAAERLDVTPAMVGKVLAQLETHLGVQLLRRTTRQQSLTDAGRRFYEEGRRVLEQLSWAEASVTDLQAQGQATLRISCATTLGQCLIAPALAGFQQEHPNVRLVLELSNSHVNPVEEGFDLLLRVGALDPDLDLVAIRLGDYRMALCASPEYLAVHGTPKHVEHLVRHRCLGNLVWNRRSTWNLLIGEAPQPWPDAIFLSNDGPALRQVALAGGGILLQPEMLVEEDIASGRLIPLLEDYLPASRPIHALYRRDRFPLTKVSSLVDYLRRTLRSTLQD